MMPAPHQVHLTPDLSVLLILLKVEDTLFMNQFGKYGFSNAFLSL